MTVAELVQQGTTPRRHRMQVLAAMARERDAAYDAVGRSQAADAWRELATSAEASRAPRYLTWRGRVY
jgi:hypothetical protein